MHMAAAGSPMLWLLLLLLRLLLVEGRGRRPAEHHRRDVKQKMGRLSVWCV